MDTPNRRWARAARTSACFLILAGAAAGLGAAPARPTRPTSAPSQVDARQDARLAQPVRLRSRAAPVRRVLKALSDATGVSLSVSGPAEDERVVAFVPEAPLADIMNDLAALYRLSWTRAGAADRPIYRLRKRPAVAREEQALRDRALRGVWDGLSNRLRHPVPAAGGREEPWAAAYPDLLPVLGNRALELLREGYVTVPLSTVPSPAGDRFRARLAPILEKQDQVRDAVIRSLQEDLRQKGVPEEGLPLPKPPSKPEECTATVDLHLPEEIRASVGLRTKTGTWYNWFEVRGSDLRQEGIALYREHAPRLPTEPGGSAAAPPPAGSIPPGDPLLKRVDLVPPAKGPEDWIETLGRVSDASGVRIYADCYWSYRQGRVEQPRAALPAAGSGSVSQILDALCFPATPDGPWKKTANSFWWRRGGAALVRSRRWLWDETTVLPSELTDRIAASFRKLLPPSRPGGGNADRPAAGGEALAVPDAEDLPRLAALSPFQRLNLGLVHRQDQWHLAVRVPARLSLPARRMLLGPGVKWEQLSPADRVTVAQLAPEPDGGPVSGYEARLSTRLTTFPEGVFAILNFAATGSGGASAAYLPLPGVGPPPELKPYEVVASRTTQ